MILETSPPRKGTSFLAPFLILFASCFLCFFECSFFLFFCDFGCPKAPFWEAFWLLFGSLGPLESESEKVCLDCTGVCGLHIQPSGKMTFPIIFGVFFKSALREASGTRFFKILNDFELPEGDHLAPKSHQKMRPTKRLKKGSAGQASNRLWVP